MRTPRLTSFGLLVACCCAFVATTYSDTIQTTGAGAAVTTIERSATFNGLDMAHNGTPIDSYHENLLYVMTSGDNWVGTGFPVFDPFGGADGPPPLTFQCPFEGNYEWVVITTTDAKKIYAMEFMYGNGWTNGNPQSPWGNNGAILHWQSWLNGSLVSSGTLGGSTILQLGTIVGFWDPNGLDEIWLRCTHPNSGDPNLQVLALDNVHAQLHFGPGSCPSSQNNCCSASPGGTAGCNDIVCCNTVCAMDSFCCDSQWDAVCGSEAQSLCGCVTPCPADLNGDHTVGGADIAILLGAWGSGGPADLDGNGHVNAADLAILLGAWGACP